MNKEPEQNQNMAEVPAICWADFGSRKPIAEVHRSLIREHLARFLERDIPLLLVHQHKPHSANNLHLLACQLTGMSGAPLKTH